MPQYFPPDVSVRIEGDKTEAKKLFGLARATLFQAINTRESADVSTTCLTRRTPDGSGYVQAYLAGPIKILTIFASPVVNEVLTAPEEPIELAKPGVTYEASMYHGVVKGGTLVTTNGVTRLRSFYPSAVCAKVTGLTRGFQDVEKLAINQYSIKPSMFSGTMKRVAQIILGIGNVKDNSPGYISGKVPTSVRRTVALNYDYKWARTHGVYKSGPKNHWLIEISITNGVLAMPLPILANTATTAYRTKLVKKGDTATLKVVDEFGGLPSGEEFPSGATLSKAIADGKVLQLLSAAALADFYALSPYALHWGWAFSEDGKHAHATAYERITGEYYYEDGGLVTPNVMVGSHWGIEFNLSVHTGTPVKPNPVGYGTAKVYWKHRGFLVDRADIWFYQPTLQRPIYAGLPTLTSNMWRIDYSEQTPGNWQGANYFPQLLSDIPYAWPQFPGTDGVDLRKCAINAFFSGNRLEQVYHRNCDLLDSFYGTSLDPQIASGDETTLKPYVLMFPALTREAYGFVLEVLPFTYYAYQRVKCFVGGRGTLNFTSLDTGWYPPFDSPWLPYDTTHHGYAGWISDTFYPPANTAVPFYFNLNVNGLGEQAWAGTQTVHISPGIKQGTNTFAYTSSYPFGAVRPEEVNWVGYAE